MSGPVVQYKPNDEAEGYRIMKEVGQGAASVVYLVHDSKGQIWSLKHVVKTDSAKDTRFLDQALLEYEVANKFNHPNIRKITRVIKKTRRLFHLTEVYLVMEYVDGVAMDRTPPRTLEEAVSLFEQVARAMAHMHERGYVHADMKPNNIMVVPTVQGPMAKLIDLGQSCPTNTVKPRIQGTPDYIAPEQVHRKPITPRTDVYNLGATMYFVLSGGKKVPTALATGDSLVSRIDGSLLEKATPLSEVNPRIPARLSELVMQCVEPEPQNRPVLMSQVADRLNLILAMLRARKSAARADGAGGGSGTNLLGGSTAAMNLNEGSSVVGAPSPIGPS